MSGFAEILETIAHAPVKKRAVTNHNVLNEAFAYAKPSSFSRGMRIDIGGVCILLISGTASIDENGVSVHVGDLPRSSSAPLKTLPGCLRAKAAPGMTLFVRPATCATSSATTRPLTRSGLRSSKSRDSIRCLHPPASRPSFAGPSC